MSAKISKKLAEEFAARDEEITKKWIRRIAAAALISLLDTLKMIDVDGVKTSEEIFLRWVIVAMFIIIPFLGLLAMIDDVRESRYRGRRLDQA